MGKSKKSESSKGKGGRPRKEIDLKRVAALCKIQCTAEEIAGFYEIHTNTLDARLKEETGEGFSEFYKKHSQGGKISLRRMQYKVAMQGNSAMLIWLGKNILGQTDSADPFKADDTPIDEQYL